MRWEKQVARTVYISTVYKKKHQSENVKEKRYSGDAAVSGRIILKCPKGKRV
jgi:hypothetical protein